METLIREEHNLMPTADRGLQENRISITSDLENLSLDFLGELASNLGLIYKGNPDQRQLASVLRKQLSAVEARASFLSYLLCQHPRELSAMLIENRWNKIRLMSSMLGPGDSLLEVAVGPRICDLVVLSRDIVAVEIKNATDTIPRANDQTRSYLYWANKVYLAIDRKKRESVKSLTLDRRVGILEFSEEGVLTRRDAQRIEPNTRRFLTLVTYGALVDLAKRHRISTDGPKLQLANRLEAFLSPSNIEAFVRDYLRKRAKFSLDMVPKQFDASDQTYLSKHASEKSHYP